METTYRSEGEYQIPNIEVNQPNVHMIGKYGRMRQEYLMKEQYTRYAILMMEGKLVAHLLDVDHQAEMLKEQLLLKMKKEQNITEELKAKDQMQWVQLMNNINSSIEEIIIKEICNV